VAKKLVPLLLIVAAGVAIYATLRLDLEIDRDEHGAINIGLRALNQGFPRGTGAFADMPELRMSWPQKPASAEAPHFSAG
jgi:hypothetical protein